MPVFIYWFILAKLVAGAKGSVVLIIFEQTFKEDQCSNLNLGECGFCEVPQAPGEMEYTWYCAMSSYALGQWVFFKK